MTKRNTAKNQQHSDKRHQNPNKSKEENIEDVFR